MTRRLLFALALASAAPLFAAPPSPEISGPKFSSTMTEATYSGGARLVYDGALLLAEEIRYNISTGTALARGNVSLTRGGQRLLADEITYRLEDRSFSLKNFRLGENPVYASGSGVLGNPTEITLRDAVVTFGEPDVFAPTLRADTLTYFPGKSIRAKGAHLGFGNVAPLVVPLFDQSVDAPFAASVTTEAGYRRTLGAFLDIGVLAPFYPGVQIGADVGCYTNRGLLAGPAAAYDWTRGDDTVRGSLHTGYIRDNGPRLSDLLGRLIPEDRGVVAWEHRQTFGQRLTLLGQLNYWSDSEVVRDFRPDHFFGVETPDTFLEATLTGNNYVASAFARAQPNTFHRVQQRLPEIRFDALPHELGAGVFQRFNGSIAFLRERALPLGADPLALRPPARETGRIDGYYQLTRNFTPREWLSVRPVAGGRLTHYTDAVGGRDDYTRVLGEIGADAEFRASGTYAYKNERWGIDGLRHLVTPRLSYRYIPEADEGRRYIPPIDREVFSTYLQPLGLGDRRSIDDLRATNTLRLGLDNTLQTRDPRYGSRDLVRLNFAADGRFDREPGERDFSEVHTEFALMPAPWLRFDLYQSFGTQDWRFREINTGLTVHDGEAWSLRLGTHYLENDIQEYVTDVRYRLNEVYEALARVHFDSRQSRFIEQLYGLRQNVRNRWLVSYFVKLYDGPRRESGTGFSIEAELVKF